MHSTCVQMGCIAPHLLAEYRLGGAGMCQMKVPRARNTVFLCVCVCVQMRGMEPHPQQNNLGIPGPPVPGVPLDRRPKLIEGTVYHIFSCDADVCMGCC